MGKINKFSVQGNRSFSNWKWSFVGIFLGGGSNAIACKVAGIEKLVATPNCETVIFF